MTKEHQYELGFIITVAFLYLYCEGRKEMKKDEMNVPKFLQKEDSEKKGESDIGIDNIKTNREAIANISYPDEKFISACEKEKLASTIKSFDDDQIEIMLESIPVELIFKRIGKELEKNRQFVKAIVDAMELLN